MGTTVNTGGSKKFVYGKDYNPKNTPEQDDAMDDAWARARKRKRKERIIRWAVVGVIVVVAVLYYFLR
jgi:hypothetical protein